MVKLSVPSAVLVLTVCSVMHAQVDDVRKEFPSRSIPVSQLPRHVTAPPDELTLYSDYGDIRQGWVVVYVVNGTQEPLALPSQDSSIYLKLEFKNDDGQWQRAQPHQNSFCGLSYFDVGIEPMHFRRFLAWKPDGGVRRTVRYKIYTDVGLVSNVGELLVDPEFVRAARYDLMSLNQAPLETFEEVLFGDIGIDDELQLDLRRYEAISILSRRGDAGGPLLLRFLHETPPDTRAHERAFWTLPDVDIGAFEDEVVSVLDQPGPLRTAYLKRYHAFQRVGQDGGRILPWLMDASTEPWPELTLVLRALTAFPLAAETRDRIEQIAGSGRFPEPDRIYAEYLIGGHWGRRFPAPLNVTCSTSSGRARTNSTRVLITVRIYNRSREPVEFEYREPHEILHLFVLRDDKCLVPANDPGWYLLSNSDQPLTTVNLAPGEHHDIKVNLCDYYELPDPGEEKSILLTYCVAVVVPGLTDAPQQSDQQCLRILKPRARRR